MAEAMAENENWLAEFLVDDPDKSEQTPLFGDNDDQRLGPRSRNAVFFREMFGESAELLERVESLRSQFEAFLETRAVFLGTESQPGLMVTVEELQGQISAIEKMLSELTSISQSAHEMRDLSQNLLVAIPDLLLGTMQSQLFAERVQHAMADAVAGMADAASTARLELAANQIASQAGQNAKRLVDEILARNEADSVIALDQRIREIQQHQEIKVERLIVQHQIALEHAEAALAEAQRATGRMEKQRDQAENRLQIERRMQGKNSLQWSVLAFAAGISLTIFLYQPAFASLSNLVKTL